MEKSPKEGVCQPMMTQGWHTERTLGQAGRPEAYSTPGRESSQLCLFGQVSLFPLGAVRLAVYMVPGTGSERKYSDETWHLDLWQSAGSGEQHGW